MICGNFDNFKKMKKMSIRPHFTPHAFKRVFSLIQSPARPSIGEIDNTDIVRRVTGFRSVYKKSGEHTVGAPKTTKPDKYSNKNRKYTKWRIKEAGMAFGIENEISKVHLTKRWMETYRNHIIVIVIFYSVVLYVTLERLHYYLYLNEHTGVRKVLGFGILISRATAGGLGPLISILFLSMSRNILTSLRETVLAKYIPFDSYVGFHKQVAWVTIIFAVLHSIGHISNFTHLSQQSKQVLACLFPQVIQNSGDDRPPNAFWYLYNTSAGATGILLVISFSVMAIFACQIVRKHGFRLFYITHRLYFVIVPLIIIHGMEGLIQEPRFSKQIIFPMIIFTIDKLISLSRTTIDLQILESHLLPSKVVKLVIKKPLNFAYKSGQWIKICIPEISETEFHPFSLTSCPVDDILSVHIRAIGPWTNKTRERLNCSKDRLPKVKISGPYGECHQEWYKYECVVMVGAGIGVTPFASVLKDVAAKMKSKSWNFGKTKRLYQVVLPKCGENGRKWLKMIKIDLFGPKMT